MDFTTWKCCRCGHKGNWIQIPGCEGYVTIFLKKVQCEHRKCKKCDKVAEFSQEDVSEKGGEDRRRKGDGVEKNEKNKSMLSRLFSRKG